jgi:transporter family protein
MNIPTSWFFLLVTIIMWGVSAVTQKMAVRYMTPMMVEVVCSYAFSVIGTVLFLYLKATGKPTVWEQNGVVWAVCTAIAATVGALTFLVTLKTVPVHVATGVTAVYPLVTFIICMFTLNEHVTFSKFMGVLLVICGTMMLAM